MDVLPLAQIAAGARHHLPWRGGFFTVTPDQLAAGAVAEALARQAPTSCWPLLRHARGQGLQTRIGMEDTLLMPDGSTAPDNAALVAAATELLARG